MSGRVYTVTIDAGALAAASGDIDLLEITPADDKPVELCGVLIEPYTEVGDAQEEFLRMAVIRGHTTSGSGGSAATPVPLDPGDAAAAFTAEVLNGTVASAGTTVTPLPFSVPARGGRELWLPEGFRPKVTQGQTTMVVRLMAAVADDLNGQMTFFLREL